MLRVGPRLVDRSRRQAQFAAKVLHGLQRLGAPGVAPPPQEPAEPDPAPSATVGREPTVLDRLPPAEIGEQQPPAPKTPAPTGPAEHELPIDGYDSLAASQVVPRLVTLSAEELRAIRSYEVAGRHRQTILNRVEQLLGSR